MRASLCSPFKVSAITPSLLKLFRISISICTSLGFADFMESAWMPKVMYLVLVKPLFPACMFLSRIPEYSSLTSLNGSA